MDLNRYLDIETETIQTALAIAKSKRPAYTRESLDVLYNFKDTAEDIGIDPLQVWYVFARKHWDCLTAAAKNPNTPQAESLQSRVCDLINYSILLLALLEDRNK